MSLEDPTNEKNTTPNLTDIEEQDPNNNEVSMVNEENNNESSNAIAQEIVVTEPSEESILKYFTAKGRTVEKLDDLFEEKIREINPYDNASDELKQLLTYNTETGRGLSDYLKLQEDIDKRPLVDLALEKVRAETGMELTNAELAEYLEETLGVDLSDELSAIDKIKLTKYTKDYKAQLKADQEKYKTPLIKAPEAEVQVEEMITLANGQKVEKSVFEAHEKSRQTYLEKTRIAVDSVASTSLKVEFDNNGTKEELTYGYDFDAADKQKMLELSEDVDQTVTTLFRTEKGFNHQDFAKALWRLDPKNWEKEVTAIVNKARAEAIESIMKMDNNVNLSRNSMPAPQGNPNVKIVPIKELFNR